MKTSPIGAKTFIRYQIMMISSSNMPKRSNKSKPFVFWNARRWRTSTLQHLPRTVGHAFLICLARTMQMQIQRNHMHMKHYVTILYIVTYIDIHLGEIWLVQLLARVAAFFDKFFQDWSRAIGHHTEVELVQRWRKNSRYLGHEVRPGLKGFVPDA